MKSFYKFFTVAIVLVSLQSCLVSKEYESAKIVNEQTYKSDSLEQDTTSMADVSWKELFTDAQLQEYIERALENNIDVRIAVQQIQSAEAYMKQGKAGYYPTLSVGAQYSRSALSKNGQQGAMLQNSGNNVFDAFELSGSLSWEADIWGKIRSQKRAYDASFMQAVATQQAIQTRLISRLVTSYYQLLAVDEQIALTQKTIQLRKTSWETTKALKEAGVGGVTSTAVKQTKAQYLDAKAFLIDLQNQTRLLENTICILMGDEPHEIERSTLASQSVTTELKIGVPAQLLNNRPDVVAAENNYRYAFEMTNVARAYFYPTITINAGGGLQSTDISNWFSINSLFGNLVGGIFAPIFNRREIRTQYEDAGFQQEQARLNYRGALIQASKEVSDALYSYKAATEKIKILKEEQNLLDEAVEDAQDLLTSGYNNTSYLEVLTAQQNALNVGLSVINTRAIQLNSIVSLYESLGGGVE